MGIDFDTPDHTTLSRRASTLKTRVSQAPAKGPVHLIVDATGLGVVGQEEAPPGRGRDGAYPRSGDHRLHCR